MGCILLSVHGISRAAFWYIYTRVVRVSETFGLVVVVVVLVGAVFFFSVHGIRRVVSFLVPLHQCRVRIRKYVLVGSICGGGVFFCYPYMVHVRRYQNGNSTYTMYRRQNNTPHKYYLPSRSFCCVYAELCTRRSSRRRSSRPPFCSRSFAHLDLSLLPLMSLSFFGWIGVIFVLPFKAMSVFLPCHKICVDLFLPESGLHATTDRHICIIFNKQQQQQQRSFSKEIIFSK